MKARNSAHRRHGAAGAVGGKLASAAALALAGLLALAGCALEVQNRQPARELARASAAPGSVHAGWRIYQARCAGCHGADALGSSGAPELLTRVAGMGPREFVDLVLRRYEWILPDARDAARETLVDEVVQRHKGALVMPAWRDEPNVDAHVLDLYAYLAGRADGSVRPGRPAR